MTVNILAFNLGATSTKVSLYQNNEEVLMHTINHPKDEIREFNNSKEQKDYRLDSIYNFLDENNISIENVDTVVTRAGVLSPVNPGAYEINEKMINFQQNFTYFDHIALTGTSIADELAKKAGPNVKAYIYDSESINQLKPISKITGLKEISQSSSVHSLNARAVVRKAAKELDADLQNSKFIVAHVGSGNTFSAFENYKIIDVVTDDEGAFSSERAGGQTTRAIVNLAQHKSKEETLRLLLQEGGLYSYLGTNDGREIEKRIADGDSYASLVYEALAYQVAKACGQMAVALGGDVNRIILTGGLAHSDLLVGWIEKWTHFIAPILVYPGEYEMEALAQGAYRVTIGEEPSQEYTLQNNEERKIYGY